MPKLNNNPKLLQKIKQLPDVPGIYQYFDAAGNLLYVGKAKSLRKRVNSYFTKQHFDDQKLKQLVSLIADVETVVVNTEFDALLLENTLIKDRQPRYNSLNKDGKQYPYLILTHEPCPRLIKTRQPENHKGDIFGPYASGKIMGTLLDLIKSMYHLRTCNLKITDENVEKGKFKLCLEYHIGNCLGPCVGQQSISDYNNEVAQVRALLKGKLNKVKNDLKEEMIEAATNLNFEKAQALKEKTDLLNNYQSKSMVVNPKWGDLDVITLRIWDSKQFINYLKISDGCVINALSREVRNKIEEPPGDIIARQLIDLRLRFGSQANEVLTNYAVDVEIPDAKISVPQIGDKKQLIALSERNLLFFRDQMLKTKTRVPAYERILTRLKEDLRLKELPIHIECFDNSNLQGTNPVSAMVCFKKAKPAKTDYRLYAIKTVVGPDDFASMHEVVTRRYTRLLNENTALPQLIVIDGGKGQLNAAQKALEALKLYGQIAIVGIAKRLEEIYFPGDPVPLHLEKKSESLKLLQQLRNEAHRFAITYHRKKRSKAGLQMQLQNVPGIGPKTVTMLYRHFKTLKAISQATEAELTAVVGNAKAQVIINALTQPEN